MTDRLRRSLAPLPDRAWELLDEEAARALRHFLTARSILDFSGPGGWELSAASKGLVERLQSPFEGVEISSRAVRPLVELRASFAVERSELERVERGSSAPDLRAVSDAARLAARAENLALYAGGPAGLEGIAGSSPHEALRIGDDYHDYPRHVARAVAVLRRAGIGGPYAMALGDRCYTGVIETTEHGGYPVLEHVRLILGGPVLWAPEVDGALVVSARGGDFEMVCGSDFALGYERHDDDEVDLFLEESFALLVHEPAAAVVLRQG